MNNKKVIVKLVEEKIDFKQLYDIFYKNTDDSTGTMLIHHGKAKYPGKYKEDYTKIKLYIKDENALSKLYSFVKLTFDQYSLNKIHVYHQLGEIRKNDTILFLAVEAKDRDSAFNSVREVLEFIKAETLIGLEEL